MVRAGGRPPMMWAFMALVDGRTPTLRPGGQ
jgi:hypothetical protein